MTDDLELLASAYLDDSATPDERARVEADEELLAEVERLRVVRALLADGEPAPISTRERHLAAALDAWDRLPASERTGPVRDRTPAGLVAPPPTPLAARRRARQRTWMLAAAAGLIVVLGGGIVLNSLVGQPATDDAADTAAVDPDAPAATDAPAELRSVEESADLAADEGGAVVAEDAPAPAPELELAESEPVGGAEAPPPEVGLVELTDLDDLARFAADALTATSSPPVTGDETADDGGFDVERCPGIDIVVGPAAYRGEPVIVGIDVDAGEAVAHSLDCVEVARAVLP